VRVSNSQFEIRNSKLRDILLNLQHLVSRDSRLSKVRAGRPLAHK
jgi:hypothetical protein